ncbi:hypothetical protein [Streptomyces chattanoogensis]|uniref:hypothetical protein n=1 Tax=Streptomyces chattanoogensis TaxID=66876 RepID=UPI0036BBFED4
MVVGAGGASAADIHGSQTLAAGGSDGILGPFNGVTTSDGVRISDYELSGGGDGIFDTALRFLMSGLFALSRTVVGFSCWLVDWVYSYPVIDRLSGTAQHVADAYAQHIVTPLGLGGIFTAWAFAFGLFLVARGRAARGFGEILLTLLIGAIATMSIVRPDVMLGYDGPLQQAQRAALQAADITTKATDGNKSGRDDPCDVIVGSAHAACEKSGVLQEQKKAAQKKAKDRRERECRVVVGGPARDACMSGKRPVAAGDVSRPITRTLTDVLVVQPFQLLQYGQLIGKSSPMYRDYVKGLVYEVGGSDSNACDLLDGKARDLCKKRSDDSKEDPCKKYLAGPAAQDCDAANADGGAQKNLLKKHGAAGKAAAAYMSEVTWDRVLGALFVLAAALIMAIVVLAMAFAMIAAQFACVVAAAATYVVFMWALLPGPNRGVLWKWVGIFASSTVLMFVISVFIPLFGVAARTLLSDGQMPLMERLALLDGVALTALVMHRRMTAKGSSLGQAFAARMRFAKIGGSHLMGDQAAGMGMALAAVGAGRGGSDYGGGAATLSMIRGGSSPAHAALAMRRAKLAGGLTALGDGTGIPGNPVGALGEARAEARRALAPLSVPLRAAQIAWVGPPREPDRGPAGNGGLPGNAPARFGRRTPVVVDGATGEVMSDPDQGVKPVGERLRERISRTRGGRVLLGASRIAWHTTVGAPAGWTRLRRRRSDLTREMHRQLNHYIGVRERWGRDNRAGRRDAATGARSVGRGVSRVFDPLNRANRLHQWINAGGSLHRSPHRSGPVPPSSSSRRKGGKRP